jgi:transposase
MPRRYTRPVQERQPPFDVGINIAKATHHADVVDAEGNPCLPKGLVFANRRAGYTHLCTTLTEATAQAAPTDVMVGCEATGPYWLSLYEALTAQGDQVLVLNPLSV